MTTRQAQYKAAMMFVKGKSARYIAEQLSMSRSVINKWKDSEQFNTIMLEVEDMENEVTDYRIRELRRKAVIVLGKALESRNPKEYQWAITKLFSLSPDFLFSARLPHPQEPDLPQGAEQLAEDEPVVIEGLRPKTEKGHEEDELTELEVLDDKLLSSRQGLMSFLNSTRGRVRESVLPVGD